MAKTKRKDAISETSSVRGNWANKTEFILSCLGYAIGIGNVWRFPYLCYRNGGGAFLVPYLLMLPLCGVPLFFMETCIGQFAGTGCVTMFRIAPLFKGVGYCMVVVNMICTTYYNVILAYPLLFLYHCMSTTLPWSDCHQKWNDQNCSRLGTRKFSSNTTWRDTNLQTPADQFFHNEILHISDGIEDQGTIVTPLLVANVVSWIIVYLCIRNGVQSVGKVVYFTVIFPYAVLLALFIRGITLPGAWDGINFYINPKWEELMEFRVWADAAIQMFFSLGPGWGGIVNMASFNNFRNNTQFDSVILPIINVLTSIFAGFVVFSVLGFMAHETGLDVSAVATGGPGLAFVTYPEAISMMPVPTFWAIMFFSMLYLLGVDSCFVQIEAIISSIIDVYPNLLQYKKYVALGSVLLMFLGSLSCITNGGMYTLQLLDWYSCATPVILNCLLEVVIIGWIYKADDFIADVEFMIKRKINKGWRILWKYVTPVILSFILLSVMIFNIRVTYNGQDYPDLAIVVGWLSAVVSIIWIPIYIVYHLVFVEKGSCAQRWKKSLKAADTWGPAAPEIKERWLTFRRARQAATGNDSPEEQHTAAK